MVAGAVTLTGTAGPALADRGHDQNKDDAFTQVNLVSDIPKLGGITDAHLINPWGIAFGPKTPLWTSNQGTNTSTLYAGTTRDNVAAVPPPPVGPLVVNASSPTGIVFNPTTDFVVKQGDVTAPSTFIFNETTFGPAGPVSSSITAWTGASVAPQRFGTVTEATKNGAFYTGLALVPAQSKYSKPVLLAADNTQGQNIDIYNYKFEKVTPKYGHDFVDPKINLMETPPYNVAYLDGRVYVTYASPNSPAAAVSVFTADGKFRKRLVTNGPLAGPWGMAIAPKKWGDFGGDLLVGNVEDGKINVFNSRSGNFRGTINGADGKPLVNGGLWGIKFGNGTIGTPNSLVFAAGIGDTPTDVDQTHLYAHGLVGLIEPVAHHDDDD